MGVPIFIRATVCTCQDTVHSYILVFHEGLWIPYLIPDSLVNPNQLRACGTIVQYTPLIGHHLYIEDPYGLVVIPM